jgi:hypothetical protein
MREQMNRYRTLKVLKIVAIAIVAISVFGFVTMNLWNWLMPSIFGLRAISFTQALGLLILGKILFGGFHRHGPGRVRGWRHGMEARWANMTPEERERFRAGMRNRRGCGWGRPEERTHEQPSM